MTPVEGCGTRPAADRAQPSAMSGLVVPSLAALATTTNDAYTTIQGVRQHSRAVSRSDVRTSHRPPVDPDLDIDGERHHPGSTDEVAYAQTFHIPLMVSRRPFVVPVGTIETSTDPLAPRLAVE